MNTQATTMELHTPHGRDGFRILAGGSRLFRISGDFFQTRDRYIAQSILTGLVDKPDTPTLEQARDIILWAQRGNGE